MALEFYVQPGIERAYRTSAVERSTKESPRARGNDGSAGGGIVTRQEKKDQTKEAFETAAKNGFSWHGADRA